MCGPTTIEGGVYCVRCRARLRSWGVRENGSRRLTCVNKCWTQSQSQHSSYPPDLDVFCAKCQRRMRRDGVNPHGGSKWRCRKCKIKETGSRINYRAVARHSICLLNQPSSPRSEVHCVQCKRRMQGDGQTVGGVYKWRCRRCHWSVLAHSLARKLSGKAPASSKPPLYPPEEDVYCVGCQRRMGRKRVGSNFEYGCDACKKYARRYRGRGAKISHGVTPDVKKSQLLRRLSRVADVKYLYFVEPVQGSVKPNVRRKNYAGHYVVDINTAGHKRKKAFTVNVYGSKEVACGSALLWRNEQLAELGLLDSEPAGSGGGRRRTNSRTLMKATRKPTTVRIKYQRATEKNKGYIVCKWRENGKSHLKCFSIDKYGYDSALDLAAAYKQELMAELSSRPTASVGMKKHRGRQALGYTFIKIKGTELVGFGMLPGDLALVHSQRLAEDRDFIVTTEEGKRVIRFYRSELGRHARLLAGPKDGFLERHYAKEDLDIQGVVIGLFRNDKPVEMPLLSQLATALKSHPRIETQKGKRREPRRQKLREVARS